MANLSWVIEGMPLIKEWTHVTEIVLWMITRDKTAPTSISALHTLIKYAARREQWTHFEQAAQLAVDTAVGINDTTWDDVLDSIAHTKATARLVKLVQLMHRVPPAGLSRKRYQTTIACFKRIALAQSSSSRSGGGGGGGRRGKGPTSTAAMSSSSSDAVMKDADAVFTLLREDAPALDELIIAAARECETLERSGKVPGLHDIPGIKPFVDMLEVAYALNRPDDFYGVHTKILELELSAAASAAESSASASRFGKGRATNNGATSSAKKLPCFAALNDYVLNFLVNCRSSDQEHPKVVWNCVLAICARAKKCNRKPAELIGQRACAKMLGFFIRDGEMVQPDQVMQLVEQQFGGVDGLFDKFKSEWLSQLVLVDIMLENNRFGQLNEMLKTKGTEGEIQDETYSGIVKRCLSTKNIAVATHALECARAAGAMISPESLYIEVFNEAVAAQSLDDVFKVRKVCISKNVRLNPYNVRDFMNLLIASGTDEHLALAKKTFTENAQHYHRNVVLDNSTLDFGRMNHNQYEMLWALEAILEQQATEKFHARRDLKLIFRGHQNGQHAKNECVEVLTKQLQPSMVPSPECMGSIAVASSDAGGALDVVVEREEWQKWLEQKGGYDAAALYPDAAEIEDASRLSREDRPLPSRHNSQQQQQHQQQQQQRQQHDQYQQHDQRAPFPTFSCYLSLSNKIKCHRHHQKLPPSSCALILKRRFCG